MWEADKLYFFFRFFSKSRTNFWNFEGPSVKIGQKLEKIERNEFWWKNQTKCFSKKNMIFCKKSWKKVFLIFFIKIHFFLFSQVFVRFWRSLKISGICSTFRKKSKKKAGIQLPDVARKEILSYEEFKVVIRNLSKRDLKFLLLRNLI